MKNKYENLKQLYPKFLYKSFEIVKKDAIYEIIYHFEIPNLCTFHPKLQIKKEFIKKLDDTSKYIIFHIGMIELISYWKAVCSKEVIIEAGYLNEEQIKWFKKLYYYGLGELFYRNHLDVSMDSFMDIKCVHEKESLKNKTWKKKGNLIPIGGGKDSCVCLEILKEEYDDNYCFMINPKDAMERCIKTAGYDEKKVFSVTRIIDKNIIKLNDQGFINGHTPFSSLIAFTSYLLAYENNILNIVLSNESSANEETVIGTTVNHQYSKSYEFERDFNDYRAKYFQQDINYFSLLRPLNELQIAKLFSHYEKYHELFRSCNLGSKNKKSTWCCNCPKCLFTFIILSPFFSDEKLNSIFKENLLDKKELLQDFISLTGNSKEKPFECVGTTDEIRYAVSSKIEKLKKENKKLPYLLKYYSETNTLENVNDNLLKEFNASNNLDNKYKQLLEKEWGKYVY